MPSFTISILVKLKKRKNKLYKDLFNNWIFETKEIPQKNQVNKVLVKAVKKEFNAQKVIIIKGKKAKLKTLKISSNCRANSL